MNKDWIKLRDRFSKENVNGVAQFMEVAKCHVNKEGQTRCPSKNCQNSMCQALEEVQRHLFANGVSPSYSQWIYHGEPANLAQFERVITPLASSVDDGLVDDRLRKKSTVENDDNELFNLLNDLQGPMR